MRLGRASAFAAIALLTAVRVASTYRVFSQTVDEPIHIAAGLRWLTHADLNLDPEHPPLARMAFALVPFLEGARDGDVLTPGPRYRHNLAAARMGNLPFLILALAVVAIWTWRLFGFAAAIVATALFASLPPVLAHAGLATTDMAACGTVAAALLALAVWLDRPTLTNAILLGLAIAIGVCSKYSFLLFFPAGAIVLVIAMRRRPAYLQLPVVVGVAALTVSTIFRFHIDALMDGLVAVAQHNASGHQTFFFGHVTRRGWWFYFPVLLFFKTPVPFIVFALAGTWLIVKKMRGEALAVAIVPLAMLLPVTYSQINLGVRHVLPLYPFLAISAAYAVVELWRRGLRWRVEICALLAWLAIGSAAAHPDYLPYFNEAALGHGERIAVDSNLDWGQDLLRLAAAVRSLHIEHLYVDYFGSADPRRFLPCAVEELPRDAPVRGWIAVSETALVMGNIEWLKSRRPVREVGKSIRLYEFH